VTVRALTVTVVSLLCLVRKSSCQIVRSSMNRIMIGTAAVLFGLGVAGCAERALKVAATSCCPQSTGTW